MTKHVPRSAAVPTTTGALPRLSPTGRSAELAAVMSKIIPDMQFARNSLARGTSTRRRNQVELTPPDMGLLNSISGNTAVSINDVQTIFQLLPETQLSMQILVSSILAPKDLVTTAVNFTLDNNRFNSELAASMLKVIDEHFGSVYKIRDILEPCLEDSLFLTGAYPLLVLAESSIDRAINSPGRISMESLSDDFDNSGVIRPLGLLGNSKSATATDYNPLSINFSMESHSTTVPYDPKFKIGDVDYHVAIVDNPNILKMTGLRERLAQEKLNYALGRKKMTPLRHTGHNISQERYETLSASLESNGAATAHSKVTLGVHFATENHRRQGAGYRPMEIITQPSYEVRPTVGHPLVMKLPVESVIPVHQPSNPSKHLGYFILLDEAGNPINTVNERDYYREMADLNTATNNMTSNLLAQAKRNMGGIGHERQIEVNELSRIYGEFLEKDIQERIRSGYMGGTVELSAPEEVYRVMLARSCAQRHTQLLYVPAQMMTYIAFDYDKYGIGQSLLHRSKVLGSMRVVNLFSQLMASVANSINRTNVDITLDPEDPAPQQTVDFLMHEFGKTRSGSFPLHTTNPNDLISYLQRASVDVTVQGNTRYPETKLAVSERQSNRTAPDSQMMDDLKERWIMSLGLTPDMLDAGANAEFATSVLANNLLLAKRVLAYQMKLEEHLQDFVVKYVLADGHLMDDLRQLVAENSDKLSRAQKDAEKLGKAIKDERDTLRKAELKASNESIGRELEALEEMGQDAVIMEFLQALRISLPKPDMATTKSQMEAFEEQATAYGKMLETMLNTEFMTSEGLGALSDLVEPTVSAIKNLLLRKWARDNNILPEVQELVNLDNDDRLDLVNEISTHTKSMSQTLLQIMYRQAMIRGTNDPAVEKLKAMIDGGGSDFGGGSGGDFGSAGDDFSSTGSEDDLSGMDSTDSLDADPTADLGGGLSLDAEGGDTTDEGNAPDTL